MLGSKVWTVGRPKMWTFYIFEPLKAYTNGLNISLIRLILIMQNPDCYPSHSRARIIYVFIRQLCQKLD